MKVLASLLLILLCTTHLTAQDKFSVIPKLGLGASFVSVEGINADNYQINTINANLKVIFSAAVQFNYALDDRISIGLEPAYVYQNLSFDAYYDNSIPELRVYKTHAIVSNSLQIPFVFNYKIDSYFISARFGLRYFALANYSIAHVIDDFMTDEGEVTKTPIIDGRVELINKGNSMGCYYGIGLGKIFKLWNQEFILELSYAQDIGKWDYIPIEPHFENKYKFNIRSFTLMFGIKL